jgi:hypothetical protein
MEEYKRKQGQKQGIMGVAGRRATGGSEEEQNNYRRRWQRGNTLARERKVEIISSCMGIFISLF